ncbi:MAG: hypothetical protein U0841_04490 [Chloroflexia bacterium]
MASDGDCGLRISDFGLTRARETTRKISCRSPNPQSAIRNGHVMLLTITTTHRPASDLGYRRAAIRGSVNRSRSISGRRMSSSTEVGEERCTAALLLDLDPVGLVRGRGAALDQYVNDRPYVASSFLSVAIAEVFRSALVGNCTARPELVGI